MGIGSVTSANSMSGMQMARAASTDPKIKTIQNEITEAKQQMQKLSSKEELSANEKANERKKLQKEISDLNAELKQQQEELRKSQKREALLAELREDQNPSKKEKTDGKIQAAQASSDQVDEGAQPADRQQTESQGTVVDSNSDGTVILKGGTNQAKNRGIDTEKPPADETVEESIPENETKPIASDMAADSGLSHKDMHAMVSADTSVQQADRQGTVIARTRDGIAILKSEMKLDELRGADTEKKQAELEKMEQKEQRATTFQFSILGEANNAIKSSAETNAAGIKDTTQDNTEKNAYINSLKISQENEQTEQQRFFVSFG